MNLRSVAAHGARADVSGHPRWEYPLRVDDIVAQRDSRRRTVDDRVTLAPVAVLRPSSSAARQHSTRCLLSRGEHGGDAGRAFDIGLAAASGHPNKEGLIFSSSISHFACSRCIFHPVGIARPYLGFSASPASGGRRSGGDRSQSDAKTAKGALAIWRCMENTPYETGILSAIRLRVRRSAGQILGAAIGVLQQPHAEFNYPSFSSCSSVMKGGAALNADNEIWLR